MISLKDVATLMRFDQVAAMLRPLDRPEMIAQVVGASLGPSASKHNPAISGDVPPSSMQFFQEEDNQQYEDPDQGGPDESDDEESQELQEDEMYLEDRENEEDGAIFLQAYHSAYADVRKDMRDRRREHGFVKHNQSRPSGQ